MHGPPVLVAGETDRTDTAAPGQLAHVCESTAGHVPSASISDVIRDF